MSIKLNVDSPESLTSPLIVSGSSDLGGAGSQNGQIDIGASASDRGVLQYSSVGNTTLSIDNTYDSASAITQLRLRTSGTPVTAVTVLGSGNVGIGTASPNTELEIKGTTADFSVHADASNYVNIQANGGSQYLEFSNNNPFTIGTTSTYPHTGFSAKMTVLANGKVGIGTASPGATLFELKNDGGTVYALADQQRINSGVSGHRAELHLTDGVTSDAFLSFLPSATATTRHISLSAGNAESDFVVRGDGNVGIGTTSPGSVLDVNGVATFRNPPKFSGTNSTGAGVTALGSNCPAVTATAVYTWISATSSDGSTVYIPCWK